MSTCGLWERSLLHCDKVNAGRKPTICDSAAIVSERVLAAWLFDLFFSRYCIHSCSPKVTCVYQNLYLCSSLVNIEYLYLLAQLFFCSIF